VRGNAKVKWWCEKCDHVAKSNGKPRCPTCREPMRWMGKVWKPGPKGNRFKHYPEGYRLTRYSGYGLVYITETLGGHGYQQGNSYPGFEGYLTGWGDKLKVKGKIPPRWLRRG
jgi:hypothetical protein